MRPVIWSLASRADIRSIDAFLHERNDAAAAAILLAISAAVSKLVEHPRMGRPLEGRLRAFGVRSTPYVIVYRIDDRDPFDAISIVRIRHRRENWIADMRTPFE